MFAGAGTFGTIENTVRGTPSTSTVSPALITTNGPPKSASHASSADTSGFVPSPTIASNTTTPLSFTIGGADEGASAVIESPPPTLVPISARSEEHTSELQSLAYLVCRLLLEKK